MGETVRRFFGRTSAGPSSDFAKLSDRELQVLELIGQRRSTRQIATKLHLGIKTVQTYRLRIKAKLGVSTIGELVKRAEELLREVRVNISRSDPISVPIARLTKSHGS